MRLLAVQGDGATLRVHLTRLRQNTGRLDPLLAEALQPLHASVAPLWDAFVSLSNTRSAGDGIAPITCVELEAWQRLQGVRLTPWESETLLHMDRVVRNRAAKD